MRELTLQSKRSPFSSCPSINFCKISLISFLGLLGLGCSMQKDASDSPGIVSNLMQKISGSDPQEIDLYTYSSEKHPGYLAALNIETCQNVGFSASSQVWTVPISTEFQRFNAKITIPESDGRSKIMIEIDGRKIFLTKSAVPSSEAVAKICNAWRADPAKRIWTSEPQLRTTITGWLNEFAPDCNFKETSAQGWLCDMKKSNPKEVARQIAGMQAHMIQKWSRHPYSLTRKLAVARNLADSINEGFSETGFSRFCKILKTSTVEELPVVFSAPRWSQNVCAVGIDGELRLKIAEIGLEMALSEQVFLHQLVEESSLLGLLQIKIPHASISNRDFWITLSPAADVAQSVLSSSEEIGGIPATAAFGCWHPIYGAAVKSMNLAAHLNLLAQQKEVSCANAEPEGNPGLVSGEYMSNSILGETEFLVGNGNSKILRLPKGQYSYVIHGLPANARQWQPSESDVHSAGQISWLDKRPHAVIDTW